MDQKLLQILQGSVFPFSTSDLLPKSPFFHSHLLAGEVLLLLPVAPAACDTLGRRNNADGGDGEHGVTLGEKSHL